MGRPEPLKEHLTLVAQRAANYVVYAHSANSRGEMHALIEHASLCYVAPVLRDG